MEEEIAIHPLFTGLTRPPMKFCVTLSFMMMNGMVALIIFLISKSFISLFCAALLGHIFGYICCMSDPRIFDLLAGKSKFNYFPNRNYWHCKSYEPF